MKHPVNWDFVLTCLILICISKILYLKTKQKTLKMRLLFYSIASMLEKSLCKLRVEKEPKNRLENDPVKEPRGQQFGIQNRSSYC